MGTVIPLFILKNGEAEENVGEILDMLLNAGVAVGWPCEERDTLLAREVPCRILLCVFATTGEKSSPGIGANWVGSLERFASQYAKRSCACWVSTSA